MAEKPSRIDHHALAQILNAESSAVQDVAFGRGQRLAAEAGQVLEVFPGAVRVTGPDLDPLVLRGDRLTPRTGEDWVSFERQTDTYTRTLALRRTGDVLFRQTASTPETLPETETTPSLPTAAQTRPGGDPGATETQGETPPPSPDKTTGAPPPATPAESVTDGTNSASAGGEGNQEQSAERGTLVRFTGNLGGNPEVFTRNGKTRIRLRVSEHRQAEDGTEDTVWHEVWTSNKIAEKTKEQTENGTLRKGAEVTIKGFKHQRGPDARGRKQQPFVRAFLVSPAKDPQANLPQTGRRRKSR